MNKTILYGICGIGNGHLFRQLPIIKKLKEDGYRIIFFSYGDTLKYLLKEKEEVIEVEVPYFIGDYEGVNFSKTVQHKKYDLNKNLIAMEYAQKEIGKPDFVISDYEPICAQYAYAYDVPFFTIDQQSKYIKNDFPILNGLNYVDERMRLNMFFPKANRIVFSFYKYNNIDTDTKVFAPIVRKNLVERENANHYLVYLSSQEGFSQSIDDITNVLGNFPEETFYIYTKSDVSHLKLDKNVIVCNHHTNSFEEHLMTCKGVITNAGHTLISEAMYLKKPVYAIPFKTYEQHHSASMISELWLGVEAEDLNINRLQHYLDMDKRYAYNFKQWDVQEKLLGKSEVEEVVNYILDKAK